MGREFEPDHHVLAAPRGYKHAMVAAAHAVLCINYVLLMTRRSTTVPRTKRFSATSASIAAPIE
ncbi:MAG: hypothetical protein OXO52_09965 [Rhodospirillales bacterium]|nr:hypothetical protein [Rhodospirillales bacterium]MDE0380782.1 hypothetical protein [Rhodospirillales bacterium]